MQTQHKVSKRAVQLVLQSTNIDKSIEFGADRVHEGDHEDVEHIFVRSSCSRESRTPEEFESVKQQYKQHSFILGVHPHFVKSETEYENETAIDKSGQQYAL